MLEDIEAAFKHTEKYRWWYGSALLHTAIILTVYFLGPYELHKERDIEKRTEAQDYVRKAYEKDVSRKLSDIRKIESIIDRIHNSGDDKENDSHNNLNNSATTESNPNIETPHPPDSQQDLPPVNNEEKNSLTANLKEAQELLENIQDNNIKTDAEKLAYLADMPLERALEEMKKGSPGIEKFSPQQIEQMSIDEIREVMTHYNETALQHLEQAVQQEKKKREGHSLYFTPNVLKEISMGDASTSNESQGDSTSDGGSGPNTSAASALAEAHNLLHGKGGGGSGATGTETGSGDGTASFDYDPKARVNNTRPQELVPQPRNRVAGRTVGAGGALADRLYLDTWYMIGPFDYRGNHMRNNAHPPELDVNLDAVYMGKGNRFIRWEYYQTNTYPLVPKNGMGDATYYGYTEVNFEEPTTAMLAMGCDDHCKVWINDQLAWESGDAFKPWYIGGGYPVLQKDVANWGLIEDYKKVHFPKGTTRIKFRLDNGYSLLFFALSIEKMRF